MRQQPKAGDRVRLTTRDFEPDYWWGQVGTVASGPHPIPSGGYYYVVTMEADGAAAAVVLFNADEIEVEAAALVSG